MEASRPRTAVVTLALCLSGAVWSVPSWARPSRECSGRAATIVGTSGSDRLRGTSGPDVIVAGKGNDTVRGLGGRDRLCGNRGRDRMVGGGGKDRLRGGQSADTVRGGPRADRLEGAKGGDDLRGGAGRDRLSGSRDDDALRGGDGRDRLKGGRGLFDFLVPGAGSDVVKGGRGYDDVSFSHARRGVDVDLGAGRARGQGRDVLRSVEGIFATRFRDVLIGDRGANFLRGRKGDDEIRGRGSAPRRFFRFDVITGDAGDDVIHGGGGRDVVSYLEFAIDGRGPGITVDLDAGTARGQGRDRLKSIEGVEGTLSNDQLQGNADGNLFIPFDGNDLVGGGTGTDTLQFFGLGRCPDIDASLASGGATGEGRDTMAGIENLDGGCGDDRLRGNGLANRLRGNSGRDTLVGRLGNDTLIGNRAKDSAVGGGGHDTCAAENETSCEANPSAIARSTGSARIITSFFRF